MCDILRIIINWPSSFHALKYFTSYQNDVILLVDSLGWFAGSVLKSVGENGVDDLWSPRHHPLSPASAWHRDVRLDRYWLSDHSYDKRTQDTMTSVWIGTGSVIIPMTKERKTRWRQSGSEWAQWSFLWQKSAKHDDVSLDRNGLSDHSYSKIISTSLNFLCFDVTGLKHACSANRS